jgi:hypothetical protein
LNVGTKKKNSVLIFPSAHTKMFTIYFSDIEVEEYGSSNNFISQLATSKTLKYFG